MPLAPICCNRKAFDLLASQLATIETPESLVRGAVAISLHQYPQGNADETVAALKQMASEIRGRVRGTQPQALFAHLHDYLFDELGFRGEREDYYQPGNSYFPQVLRSRRGLPILLSAAYVSVARWAGLNAWGVGLPGHFLAGVECGGVAHLVDPFDGGRLLTPDDAAAKIREVYGPEAEFTRDLLEPVSHRMWLTRMMQNLLRTFGSSGHFAEVGAMLELEMLLWPGQDHLQRDFALILARLGMTKPAGEWLGSYLQNNPEDPQKSDLEQILNALTA